MEVFNDLTDKQSKGVIIHHWDTDGIVSAAILLNYFAEHFPNKKMETFVPTITNYYVKRKGVQWFIDQVLPSLPDTVHYIVTSDGPDKDEIEKTIIKHHLTERVTLLGSVSETKIKQLYAEADLFVMPNIAVRQ